MKRVILRIAALLGITAAAATALVYGVRPAEVSGWRLTRAPALVSYPDGGQEYRTLRVPVLQLEDGGLSQLPDEVVASCGLSYRLGLLPAGGADDCLRGELAPPVRLQWVGGSHDTPDEGCTDEDVCTDGGGVALGEGPCAARGWPDAGDCTVGGEPAPWGTTLAAGTWAGPGCIRRVCTVFATGSYPDDGWPAACPLLAPDGGLVPPRGEGS